MRGEAEALAKSPHVRVHSNAVHHAVRIAEHHVRSFARNAAERQDFFHGRGDFAVEFFFDEFGGRKDAFCFRAVKSGGVDIALKFFSVCADIVLQHAIFFEKFFCHLIYFFVGALRREDDCDQELPRIFEFQRDRRVRIFFLEHAHDLPRASRYKRDARRNGLFFLLIYFFRLMHIVCVGVAAGTTMRRRGWRAVRHWGKISTSAPSSNR